MSQYFLSVSLIITKMVQFYESIKFRIFQAEFNIYDIILSFAFIALVVMPLFDNDDENPF